MVPQLPKKCPTKQWKTLILPPAFCEDFYKTFPGILRKPNFFTDDLVSPWRRQQKIDFLNKKLQCHHMIPRWKEETCAIILVKKSSKNKFFSPSYSYFRVRRRWRHTFNRRRFRRPNGHLKFLFQKFRYISCSSITLPRGVLCAAIIAILWP